GKYYQSGEGKKQLLQMQKQALEIAKKAQKQIIEERAKQSADKAAEKDSVKSAPIEPAAPVKPDVHENAPL
ncbi:MAG: hypothetical protein JWR50_1510, partial [Mucilaginibacter sp.]|nr:hypothetical protein [Mucilaginibacter sp.]